MGFTTDHLNAVTYDVQCSLEIRDPHACPPRRYLHRMVVEAISAIGANPDDCSGWFAEMVNDPATGAPWVDGNPEWMTGNPLERATRAYWEKAGEDNREFYPEVGSPEFGGVDTPGARAACRTTMCAQLELACEVFDLVRWNVNDPDEHEDGECPVAYVSLKGNPEGIFCCVCGERSHPSADLAPVWIDDPVAEAMTTKTMCAECGDPLLAPDSDD